MTLASIWKRIWEACEILKLKHGSIALWYSIVILFFSLSFEEKQIYHNGKNFCAFDASFDLETDLRSLWNSEAKTWFHVLLVFYCHSVFFSIIYRENKFITTAIIFAHLTLASIWKRIWEACEILKLKHGSIALWYSFVILFFSLSFEEKQIYHNGKNFCAFDASFDLKKDLRSLWNSDPKTWFHVLLVFYCHSVFFSIIYRENKFITTAIIFAHLTLASISKRIWEACEILKLKHGSIALWYSIVILFFSLSFEEKQIFTKAFEEKQIYHNGKNFCAFDASFDLKKDLRSLWNSDPKTWFHVLLVFFCHSVFFSIISIEKTNLLTTAIIFAHLTLASIWKRIWEACEILTLKHGSIAFMVFFCHSVFFSFIRRETNLSQRQKLLRIWR